MRRRLAKAFPYFFFLGFITGCAGNGAGENAGQNTEQKSGDTGRSLFHTTTGIDEAPELKSIDSLEVLYFKDPYGDSLRYQRFFTYFGSGDRALVHSLLKDLGGRAKKQAVVGPCRSEGKIYAYRGGEVLKTIYFAMKGDSCRYLYFIRNGEFIYLPLSDSLRQELVNRGQFAREPPASAVPGGEGR